MCQGEPDRGELVTRFLERERARREALFQEFMEECQRDPRFLDRALKHLKPMRGRGGTPRASADMVVVDSIRRALRGHPVGHVVDAIAVTLKLSVPQARRL